jgi:hypothetical protein
MADAWALGFTNCGCGAFGRVAVLRGLIGPQLARAGRKYALLAPLRIRERSRLSLVWQEILLSRDEIER